MGRSWRLPSIATLILVGCGNDSITAQPPSPDYDRDGISDSFDQYPFGEDMIDTDQDGYPDVYDLSSAVESTSGPVLPEPPDYDNDGLTDSQDEYPAGQDLIDTDGDGQKDVNDIDLYTNRNIEDSNGDYIPDARDDEPSMDALGDADRDGYANYNDLDPYDDNDLDEDGVTDSSLDSNSYDYYEN